MYTTTMYYYVYYYVYIDTLPTFQQCLLHRIAVELRRSLSLPSAPTPPTGAEGGVCPPAMAAAAAAAAATVLTNYNQPWGGTTMSQLAKTFQSQRSAAYVSIRTRGPAEGLGEGGGAGSRLA